MTEDLLLLNPGPVPLADSVRDVMREPMVSHRSSAFEADYERANDGVKYVFEHSSIDGSQTASGGTSLLLMGTATLGMEAAIANLVGPDSTVVPVVNGKFGRRFRRIAERYATVRPVTFDWGESIDIDTVAEAIDDDVDLVAMVHNETSTGLLNPVAAIGELAAQHDAQFVVDGVTSIGGDAFHLDDWGVDIAITDAQKALAAPPGISAVYLAEGIDAIIDGGNAPFYADLPRHVRKVADNQTPFTSAVPLVRAMAASMERIREEGMASRISRHRRQARAFRSAFAEMDLELFPTVTGPSRISNTVTAVSLPDRVRDEPSAFFDAVAERNVSISGGQAHLGGEIFRVSTMGELTSEQILRGVRSIGEALDDIGHSVELEAAIGTAQSELDT